MQYFADDPARATLLVVPIPSLELERGMEAREGKHVNAETNIDADIVEGSPSFVVALGGFLVGPLGNIFTGIFVKHVMAINWSHFILADVCLANRARVS